MDAVGRQAREQALSWMVEFIESGLEQGEEVDRLMVAEAAYQWHDLQNSPEWVLSVAEEAFARHEGTEVAWFRVTFNTHRYTDHSDNARSVSRRVAARNGEEARDIIRNLSAFEVRIGQRHIGMIHTAEPIGDIG